MNTQGEAVAAGGTLSAYVPFYFANRSPMLFAIHTGYVQGYVGGQTEVLHLVSTVAEVASDSEHTWCFTDGHAVEDFTEFFEDQTDLAKVDWRVIANWSWKNTDQDPDRKRRKQAEFLIHRFAPWELFSEIGVQNVKTAKKVEKLLKDADHRPPIAIQGKWYY